MRGGSDTLAKAIARCSDYDGLNQMRGWEPARSRYLVHEVTQSFQRPHHPSGALAATSRSVSVVKCRFMKCGPGYGFRCELIKQAADYT